MTTRRVAGGLQTPGIAVIDTSRTRGLARVRRAVARRRGANETELSEQAIAEAIAHADPEVVHAHFGPDGAMVRRATHQLGLPLVVSFHGYDATVYPEFLREESPACARLVDNWDDLMREVAAIITPSGFVRDELISRSADPDRVHVIPCGVDMASMPWTSPPADGGILFVGRLVEKKGCADLLQAVAELSKRPAVRIIGDGPLRDELEQLAAGLRVDAQFLGVRNSREVFAAMQRASVVAMPSQRAANGDCEGLPVTSLEAAAIGRPVVGYRHSGLVESVISGETGLLAPEGDIASLTELLDGLLADHTELKRLAVNARRHVEENFELSDCLRRVEQVYEKVAESPTAPREAS